MEAFEQRLAAWSETYKRLRDAQAAFDQVKADADPQLPEFARYLAEAKTAHESALEALYKEANAKKGS